MGRITFILAGDEKFKDLVDVCAGHLDKLNYPYRIYDLGGLGKGKEFFTDTLDFQNKKGFVPCSFKPRIIQDALIDYEFVAYIDTDTTVLHNIDEVQGDYDIGVTQRTKTEQERYQNNPRVGSVNSGVIFFRRTLKTLSFVDQWIRLTDQLGIEQEALNTLLKDTSLNVRHFPTTIYNNYYFDGTTRHAKIIHYKSSHKKRMLKDANRSRT